MATQSVPLQFENVYGAGFKISGGGIMTREELPSTGDWPADLSMEKIIQTDQSFKIGFKWSQEGPAVLHPSHFWRVQVFLEKMGGDEFTLPAGKGYVEEPFVPNSPNTYNATITFNPYDIPVGLYRITGVVQLAGPFSKGQRQGVVAFADFGLVQIYED